MTMKRTWQAGVLMFMGACATETTSGGTNGELIAPEVHALSTYSASLGTLVEIYGEHFPTDTDDELFLVFEGTFTAQDGSREQVQTEFPLRVVDAGTARWTSFGPYSMPLSHDGASTGTFDGTVSARAQSADGFTVEGAHPASIRFEVKPSIVVHELQPISASCADPVRRAIGGVPYRARVEAVGFEPASFTYTLSFPTIANSTPISIRHVADGTFDSIGDSEELKLPAVPEGAPLYAAVLSVEARAQDGQSVQSLFALEVHRPLEIFYNGSVEVAEIFEPTPVSGCIPGGSNGRDASYNESTTETRSRSYAVNWNQGWLQAHSVSSQNSTTLGTNENNSVAFGTTDGQSFNWSVGTELSTGVKLEGLVELGAKTNLQQGGEVSRTESANRGRDVGVNSSTTTTDTDEASESSSQEQGQSFSWDVSSSNYIGRDFSGTIIAGQFGVFYRQTMRLVRHAAVVTYNLCGTANVVGEVDIQDWAWSPDLGQGSSCPPLPLSNLPPRQCIISPCTDQ